MDGNECTLPDPGDIGQLSTTSVRPCMRWADPAGGGGDDPGVGAEWEGRRARGGGGQATVDPPGWQKCEHSRRGSPGAGGSPEE